MVELSTKKVQKSPEERVWGKRKAAVDVSGEENAFTLLRLWLGLVPREPRRFVGDQSPLHQVVEVILVDRRADPVTLDPSRRQARS